MAKLKACMLLAAGLILTLVVNVRSDGWFDRKTAQECLTELSASNEQGVKKWISNNLDKDFNCQDQSLEWNLVNFQVSKEFKKTHPFMRQNLKHYLSACGLENRFKKLIDRIDPSKNRRTLYNYLERPTFWSRDDVRQLLRALNGDITIDGVSGKLECNDKNSRYLKAVRRESGFLEDLQALVGAYYKLWLEECNYEARFQKAVGSLNRLPYEHWDSDSYATLYSYQQEKHSAGLEIVIGTLSSISMIFKPTRNPAGIHCKQEHQNNLLKLLSNSIYSDEYFENFVKGYVVLYFDKCGLEDDFKKVTNYIEQSWTSKPSATLYTFVRQNYLSSHKLVSVIRNLSRWVSEFEQAKCTNELQTSLIQLLENGKENDQLRELLFAYVGFYLSECGLEGRLKKTIKSISQVWPRESRNPKSYPTLTSQLRRSCNTEEDGPECVLYVLQPMELLLEFENFSKEKHCNSKLVSNLVKPMSALHRLGEFKSFALDLFAFYLDECGLEQSFKRTFATEESTDEPTLFDYLSSTNLDGEESWQQAVISITGELFKSASTQSDPDCSQELINNFSLILNRLKMTDLEDSYPTLEKRLSNYKDKCGGQS